MAIGDFTAKRRKFADGVIAGKSLAKAAIAAGYSKKGARQAGSRLMKDEKVLAYIARGRVRAAERAELDIARVISELYDILTVDVGEVFDDNGAMLPLSEWPPEHRKALSALEVVELKINDQIAGHLKKFKFWSKTTAADQLLKHLGGYAPEKHEILASYADLVAKSMDEDE